MNTIQVLQIEMGKKYSDREDKLDFLSEFFQEEVKSSKDLSDAQRTDAINWLKTGRTPDDYWARFDNKDPQHRMILSICLQLGEKWTIANPNRNSKHHTIVNLVHLSNWLKSKKCSVNKPLKQMTYAELRKVINHLNQINEK